MHFDVRGTTVLITGGAGGLGQGYARRAVAGGAAQVVLWDRDPAALDRAVDRLGTRATRVAGQVVDVTALESVQAAADQVQAEVGGVDVLVNNAGIVRGSRYFWQQDAGRDIGATMQVNALAPMHVARAFLPEMVNDPTRPRRLLTVASAAGTVASPRMAVYAASKWAALGWSESVRLELEQAGHRHVRVTTFCPTYIATGMFSGAGGMLMTRTIDPDRAVDASWAAMLAGRPVLYMPWTVQLGRVLRAVLPLRAWDAAAGSLLGIYHSMDHFTGHAPTAAPAVPGATPAVADAPEAGRPAGNGPVIG